MSQLSSYTSKFRAQRPPSHGSSSSRVIKRQRESLVCTQCRISKIRCDRAHPCGACVSRNNAHGCEYSRNETSGVDSGHIQLVRRKLADLESMIKQLADNQTKLPNEEEPRTLEAERSTEEEHAQQGSVHHEQSEHAGYTGQTHWSAVLEDLHDLGALLRGPPDIPDLDQIDAARATLRGGEPIFGAFSSFSLADIVEEYLPARVEVDRLLSIYFQGPIFIIPILHTHQFQRQYRNFWSSATEVNPLWLSILFSICFISAEVRKITEPGAPPLKDPFISNAFLHTAAGQCLVLGEFNRPQHMTIEALAMYAQSKHILTLDPSREAGVVLSIAVRTAYYLGYHRDADSSGKFSVFEGEMRRRCWAICRQMDLMTSFELGLPSHIYLENSDTKSPRNLLDSDFDEDSTELPPSRSENEVTRQLWFIVKDSMMESFAKVCRDALSFHVKTEAEVLELDQEIRRMYENIPAVLRIRPLCESVTEAPFIIFCRVYVEFIYLKCLCVLHRRYMAKGNMSSTVYCIAAGKTLVAHFIDISKEFAPGGQLYMHRWMLTNYTMNDFLLGVMVLCFAVHVHRSKPDRSSSTTMTGESEKEILELLESAHAVLLDTSDSCQDARRVARFVRLILDNELSSGKAALRSPQLQGVARNIEPTRQDGSDGTADQQLSTENLESFTFMNSPVGEFDWSLFDLEAFNQDMS